MPRNWRFYGREAELGTLLRRLRQQKWSFGAIRGRRRIGKTALVQQALAILQRDPLPARKALLVQLPEGGTAYAVRRFRGAVQRAGLGSNLNRLPDVSDLFGMASAIRELCRSGVIVALDEFQRSSSGALNPLPSLLQEQVDRLRDDVRATGSLILLGSVQSEMEALLQDRNAPLYGRTNFDLDLEPWTLKTIFEVCEEHGASDPSRCLTLLTLFGGVPKYWQEFSLLEGIAEISGWSSWAEAVCSELFLVRDAPLRREGEFLLAGELRQRYLSVLEAVASLASGTSADIRQALPDVTSITNSLQTLVKRLRLIEKQLPVFAPTRSNRARYSVSDPFLCAWLHVIQPCCDAARFAPEADVARRLLPRLQTLEGFAFERVVRRATEEASRAGAEDFPLSGMVRGYWNRPRSHSNLVEIDLVAWNDSEQRVRFGSCKRSAAKHDAKARAAFRSHVERFLQTREGRRFRAYDREFALFAPAFPNERRATLQDKGWVCRDLGDFRSMLVDKNSGDLGSIKASPKIAPA